VLKVGPERQGFTTEARKTRKVPGLRQGQRRILRMPWGRVATLKFIRRPEDNRCSRK
jgi:hypothetical protein